MSDGAKGVDVPWAGRTADPSAVLLPPHDPQHAAVHPALGPLGLDAAAVEQLGDLPQGLALVVKLPNPGQRLLLAPVLYQHSFRPEVPAEWLVAADPFPAAALDL